MEQCISCKYCGNDIERDPCRGCTFGSGFGSNWEPAGEKSQWIPVTERLPNVEGVYMESTVNRRLVCYMSDKVLVCEEDGSISVCGLLAHADDPKSEHNPIWLDEFGNAGYIEPVAWMPLPEPFKPKEVTR